MGFGFDFVNLFAFLFFFLICQLENLAGDSGN